MADTSIRNSTTGVVCIPGVTAFSVAPAPTTRPRHCGNCSACCSGVLRLEVEGNPIYPGHPCRHCRGIGCGIYTSRPEVCRNFVCGWLQGDSSLPRWLRPDRSGIILLAAERRWRGVPVAVGQGPRQSALRWLMKFSETRQRPLLYQVEVNGVWYGWGSAAFRAELSDFLKQGGPLFAKRMMVSTTGLFDKQGVD